jgi:hypothetical protein
MRDESRSINPQLADIFRTAIDGAVSVGADAAATPPPTINVHGSRNVLAWGGTVFVNDAPRQRRPRKAQE